MSIRFYFVRHGQSDANLRDEYYNDRDASLTRVGIIQAARIGFLLKDCDVTFDAIFCSPYRRAIETCVIAMFEADIDGTMITVDDRIGEREFDGLEGRVIDKDYNRKLYEYGSNQSEIDGVETLESLETRAREFIDKVAEIYQDANILVFSHGVFGLAFRAVIQGRPESGNLFDWKFLDNGEMMILEYRC